MKSLLLCCLLTLTACFPSAAALAENLRVGAARVDITPPPDAANPPSGKYAHDLILANDK